MDAAQRHAERFDRQGGRYLRDHGRRFYDTYLSTLELLQPGARVVSVGAGSAYVEMVLTRHHQVSMTVIDFAEAVQYHAPQYEELGWKAIAADLTTVGRWPEDATGFHAVLLAEIVEHIP